MMSLNLRVRTIGMATAVTAMAVVSSHTLAAVKNIAPTPVSLAGSAPVTVSYQSFGLIGASDSASNGKHESLLGNLLGTQAYSYYSMIDIGGTTIYAVTSCAVSSRPNPGFSLKLTNNTGQTVTSLTLTGTVAQFRDNGANNNETLTASVSGATPTSVSGLNITTLPNDGNSATNTLYQNKDYHAILSGFSLENGQSVTITWTDAYESGKNAWFGLKDGLQVSWAVPEPASMTLLALGGLALLARRRQA